MIALAFYRKRWVIAGSGCGRNGIRGVALLTDAFDVSMRQQLHQCNVHEIQYCSSGTTKVYKREVWYGSIYRAYRQAEMKTSMIRRKT